MYYDLDFIDDFDLIDIFQKERDFFQLYEKLLNGVMKISIIELISEIDCVIMTLSLIRVKKNLPNMTEDRKRELIVEFNELLYIFFQKSLNIFYKIFKFINNEELRNDELIDFLLNLRILFQHFNISSKKSENFFNSIRSYRFTYKQKYKKLLSAFKSVSNREIVFFRNNSPIKNFVEVDTLKFDISDFLTVNNLTLNDIFDKKNKKSIHNFHFLTFNYSKKKSHRNSIDNWQWFISLAGNHHVQLNPLILIISLLDGFKSFLNKIKMESFDTSNEFILKEKEDSFNEDASEPFLINNIWNDSWTIIWASSPIFEKNIWFLKLEDELISVLNIFQYLIVNWNLFSQPTLILCSKKHFLKLFMKYLWDGLLIIIKHIYFFSTEFIKNRNKKLKKENFDIPDLDFLVSLRHIVAHGQTNNLSKCVFLAQAESFNKWTQDKFKMTVFKIWDRQKNNRGPIVLIGEYFWFDDLFLNSLMKIDNIPKFGLFLNFNGFTFEIDLFNFYKSLLRYYCFLLINNTVEIIQNKN